MFTAYLRLQYLNDEHAVFMGENEQTAEVTDMFGRDHEVTNRYPAFQLARKEWEVHGCPTLLEIKVRDFTHVTVED